MGDVRVPFSNATTSLWAAMSMIPHVARLEKVVLRTVCDAYDEGDPEGMGGMTRQELQLATGLGIQTVTARVKGLIDRGILVETDKKRRTMAGKWAIVVRPGRGPYSEPKKQTHGRIAAAVKRERERVIQAALVVLMRWSVSTKDMADFKVAVEERLDS